MTNTKEETDGRTLNIAQWEKNVLSDEIGRVQGGMAVDKEKCFIKEGELLILISNRCLKNKKKGSVLKTAS